MAAVIVVLFFLLLLWINIVICASSSSRLPPASRNESGVGIKMEIIHRYYSPGSPFHNPNITLLDRAIDMVRRSNLRADNYSRRRRYRTNDRTTPMSSAHGELLAIFYIGTPGVKTYALLDTGSDVPWFQCLPCNNCYDQLPVLYDPHKSQSYTLIKCSDIRCDHNPSIRCNSIDRVTCSYVVAYADNSRSVGDLATETFTFGDGTKATDIIFGCGHQNTGTFSEEMSGLIGMGTTSLSLLSQLKETRLSFCFPQMTDEAVTSGQLRLGAPAIFSNPRIKLHPGRPDVDAYYLLPLVGITVEFFGPVKFPRNLFEPKKDGSGGFLLDTGTYFTRLFREAYDAVIEAVAVAVGEDYPRVYEHPSQFELCYDGGKWDSFRDAVPGITFHFTGGDLVLKDYATFMDVDSAGTWCLPILTARGTSSFFGAFHMQGYAVGLDLAANEVSFTTAPHDCTSN
ncbi:hypothetical protein H6P81_004864 [Aristolochia fimbriata]|uniref:Peptidase A1 domain-containing protein n=1 Tax=Aristolochia fimbriata TaxID=158543 RepID=A0AAV7EV50_ARIFI|nr:hypothetical protein H6P81_004864 [Aristolochia fimbriata]